MSVHHLESSTRKRPARQFRVTRKAHNRLRRFCADGIQIGQINADIVTLKATLAADMEEIMRHADFLTVDNAVLAKEFRRVAHN